MYLRLPQGFITSGDVYTHCYNEIIKNFPCKVKIIDDTLLCDTDIEQSLIHTWDNLTTSAKNGLLITPDWISPSPKMLTAIKDFPVPKDITGA